MSLQYLVKLESHVFLKICRAENRKKSQLILFVCSNGCYKMSHNKHFMATADNKDCKHYAGAEAEHGRLSSISGSEG